MDPLWSGNFVLATAAGQPTNDGGGSQLKMDGCGSLGLVHAKLCTQQNSVDLNKVHKQHNPAVKGFLVLWGRTVEKRVVGRWGMDWAGNEDLHCCSCLGP